MAARQLMHISLGWHVVRMFVVHVPSDLKNYNILCPLARDISSGLRWTQNVSGVIYIKVTTISMFVFFCFTTGCEHVRLRPDTEMILCWRFVVVLFCLGPTTYYRPTHDSYWLSPTTENQRDGDRIGGAWFPPIFLIFYVFFINIIFLVFCCCFSSLFYLAFFLWPSLIIYGFRF